MTKQHTITRPIGILHPGEMGISVAAAAQNSGNAVYWVSEGRSEKTRQRAAKHNLIECATLAELCATCSVILSVCPPDSAEDTAQQVIAQHFTGLYVDANAIAPARAERIGRALTARGASFVDGGIIGGPAWEAGKTWLHLSGPQAHEAAACFAAGPLATNVLSEEIGAASALKMCYAGYSKGTTALLAAVLASAESMGVRSALQEQWQRDGSELAAQAPRRLTQVTAKAWRFAGEMEEIAATLASAGQPSGFHDAAAILYRRLAHFKDAQSTPSLEAVLAALLQD